MELTDILNGYRESARVVLSKDVMLEVTHTPIDLELWERAMAVEEQDGDLLEAKQLHILGARVEELTNGGAAVEFSVEFWRGMHPALREHVANAVGSNVPRTVLAAYRLKKAAEQNVEDNQQQT